MKDINWKCLVRATLLHMDRRAGTRRLAEAGLGAADKARVAATE